MKVEGWLFLGRMLATVLAAVGFVFVYDRGPPRPLAARRDDSMP